ncbi:uncharacterized protein LOC144744044 [Ciona intestinalis]
MVENAEKQFGPTHAVYHRLLQPAYERMIIQHVYKNKINLKSGATGQLLQKRPKTTGYLGKKWEGTSYPASTYWNPTVNEHWQWQHSVAPSIAHSIQTFQENQQKPITVPQLTDEYNIKASSRANTFSATTRVREVPVSGIYKKEIQEFRSRTPSARGVRAVAISNRSLIASQSGRAHSVGAASVSGKVPHASDQPVRMQREFEQLQLTRERKRQAQITSHRMDRMYYLNGSSSKIHSKYRISDEELSRIRMIAVARGIKVPSIVSGYKENRGSVSGPHSTPRGPEDDDVARQGSGRTIIPTADNLSIGDVTSLDGTEKGSSRATKEDRATSDNEEDRLELLRELEAEKSVTSNTLDVEDATGEEKEEEEQSEPNEKQETVSVKSDSAALQGTQRNVTFLTELTEAEKTQGKS